MMFEVNQSVGGRDSACRQALAIICEKGRFGENGLQSMQKL